MLLNEKTLAINSDHLPFYVYAGIFFFVCIINAPIIQSLWYYSFDDGTYSHAYLIPFMSFYLTYIISKEGMMDFRKNITWPPILLLVVSAYFFYVFSNAQLSTGYWALLLLTLMAASNIIFRFNLKLLFSISFLIYLIPFWGVLITPLQNLSVISVTFIMSLTNIPVFVEKQFIQIPSGTFEIAGGCSGLRYLITALAISSLYIFLYIRDKKNAAIFFSVAVLGALVTNWIRITLLIIIGHNTEMTSPLMEDHNNFGWYIFLPFMFILFLFGNKLSTEVSNINSKKPKQEENNGMNITLLIIALTITGVSSSIFTTTFKSNKIASILPKIADQPKIFNYDDAITDIASNGVKITYLFDGSNLDSKPTYFANKLIPEGWKVESIDKTREASIYNISKFGENATLRISYVIAQEKFPTIKTFKKERIKQAFFGSSSTSLIWDIRYSR